jgi:energy-coupling factor transport system permease protein
MRALLDAQPGGHVLFTLPEIPLPDVAAGIRIGGPVNLEGVLAALYDGLRLATLLVCVGAANVLANPKRLLAMVPSALYELGVAVTVTLTVAPQLVESAQRIRRARALRGSTDGRRRPLLRGVLAPLMTDALDRSLLLAAAMDSRGYGRPPRQPGRRRLAPVLTVLGVLGTCVGTYGLLDASTPRALGLPMLVGGLVVGGAGLLLAGRGIVRTRYRPDPWRAPEWAVAASGLFVGACTYLLGSVDPQALNPSLQPLQWPALELTPVVVVLVGVLPAWAAPPPPTLTDAPAVEAAQPLAGVR